MPRQHRTIVDGVTEPMPGALLVWLRAPDLAAAASAGQFVMVRAGEGLDPYLRYPLPVHRLTGEGVAVLATASSGAFGALGRLAVGDDLDVYGPCGRALDLPAGTAAVGLLGQAPVLGPLLAVVDRHRGPLQLLTLAPTPRQSYPRQLLPATTEYAAYTGSDGVEGFWEAAALLVRWADRVYASGGLALYRRLADLVARERVAVPEGFASVWVERDMACGAGACGSCLVMTRRGARRACVEGPFFDLSELVL